MHTPLAKRAALAIFGKGKSKAAKKRREKATGGVMHQAIPGRTFSTRDGAEYEVRSNGSLRRVG